MYVCNGFLNTQNTPTWVLSLNAARSIEVHLRPYAIIGKFPMQLWEFCLQLLVFLLCTKQVSNGNVYTLYLYDANTHEFYEEKTINPKEQVIMNFIDHNKSEFYIDKSSALVLRIVINDSEYTCTAVGQNEYVLHASSEKLKELNREIN